MSRDPLNKLPTEGLSSDYVYREAKRTLAGVQLARATIAGLSSDFVSPPAEPEVPGAPNEILIWPGIDVDIRNEKDEK